MSLAELLLSVGSIWDFCVWNLVTWELGKMSKFEIYYEVEKKYNNSSVLLSCLLRGKLGKEWREVRWEWIRNTRALSISSSLLFVLRWWICLYIWRETCLLCRKAFRNLVAFFFAVIIMARKRIWFSGKKRILLRFFTVRFWDRWNSVQLLCGRPSSAGGCFYAE